MLVPVEGMPPTRTHNPNLMPMELPQSYDGIPTAPTWHRSNKIEDQIPLDHKRKENAAMTNHQNTLG